MIMVEGHSLDVQHDPKFEREVIILDGERVSAARTFSGTLHRFAADGSLWEVETRAAPWPAAEIKVVKRDGETRYTEI